MPLTKLGQGGGIALAVDLLNSWDELHDPPELLSVRWLRRYLEFHGFPAAAAGVGEPEIAPARELRERLRRGFDAPTEKEAVEALNEILRDFGEPPQLERSGGGWRFRYGAQEGPDLRFLAAPASVGLLEAIRDHGLS